VKLIKARLIVFQSQSDDLGEKINYYSSVSNAATETAKNY